MKQKLFAIMCALFAMQMAVWAQNTSGFCGNPSVNGGKEVKWKMKKNGTSEGGSPTYTLTIRGSGAMANYDDYASEDCIRPWDCKNITEVSILGRVTSIGNHAFSGRRTIETVTKSGLNTSYNVFIESSGFTNITIPNSVTSIGVGAFMDCLNLTNITIPSSVTSIGGSAFANCKNLTNIIIPNSVKAIGTYAFSSCSNLACVTLSNSVTDIDYGTFSGCSSLTNITIPNSVTTIGRSAFEYCSSLTSITIPNSVTTIGSSAFSGCSSLTCITIPSSVKSIDFPVFGSCLSLEQITVDENNAVYDSRDNCNAIIKTATNTLVAGCGNTVIPNSVTTIGSSAFSGCSSLTCITIPSSVKSIDYPVFGSCLSLEQITVDENNAVYDSRDNCNAIIKTATNTLVAGCGNTVIPNSVTAIGKYAFSFCSNLTSLTIPNSVTTIDFGAFSFCSELTNVTIPNSVTAIRLGAFENCIKLANVTCLNSVPPTIEEDSFGYISPTATLRVPDVEAYKASDWAKYFSVIELLM